MKTTYKILHYVGPIHILRRWYQELLAYNFSCIHRSHLMMVDVDYLSRMHNSLVKSHVVIANRLSLADRSKRPAAYSGDALDIVLSKGTYTIKFGDRQIGMSSLNTIVTSRQNKKQRIIQSEVMYTVCSCNIHVLRNNNLVPDTKWRLPKDDSIHHCEDVQECTWLSINRHKMLFMGTDQSCSSRHIVHYQLTW